MTATLTTRINQAEADLATHRASCTWCLNHPTDWECGTAMDLRAAAHDLTEERITVRYLKDVQPGTEVVYEGSQARERGVWMLDGPCTCFGDHECGGWLLVRGSQELAHVRRQSFYPVEEP